MTASGELLRVTSGVRGWTFAAVLLMAGPDVYGASFSAIPQTLSRGREAPTATLLPNGKVLVAGGFGLGEYLNSLEVLDPYGSVTPVAGTMNARRYQHSATLLRTGKVLIVGGSTGAGGPVTATADLYDPATGMIAATGNLNVARHGHTATLLNDGRVLIAGGSPAAAPAATASNTAELYDPASGMFTLVPGTMSVLRHMHAAARLQNGKVLITGGYIGVGTTATASADLFDPAGAGSFTPAMDLIAARYGHSMTVLDSGKALIAAGFTGAAAMMSTEIFDPATGLIAAGADLQVARYAHSSTLLPNGKVLIAGGFATNTAELFDPAGATSTAATVSMTTVRFSHTATLLPSGKVLLLAGDDQNSTALASGEVYDSATPTVTAIPNMNEGRLLHTATVLADGRVLIAGGFAANTFTAPRITAEVYDPQTGLFTPTGDMPVARARHKATLLKDGRVLLMGGDGFGPGGGISRLSSAALYDPVTGTFVATGSMATPRIFHTATLLDDGRVLVAGGGTSVGANTAAAELYDPKTGIFTATGNMTRARSSHAGGLQPDGKVVISGGVTTVIDVYDPDTGTFAATATGMSVVRSGSTSTLLPGGNLLLYGGSSAGGVTNGELFDPATQMVFAQTATGVARIAHHAVMLEDGGVLLVGGDPAFGVDAKYLQTYDPVSRAILGGPPDGAQIANPGGAVPTRLTDGKVLITGGLANPPSNQALIYDPGLGFPDAKRPVLNSVAALCVPTALALTGSNFEGLSEGSSGMAGSSATNVPTLRLQRLTDERTEFVVPSSWSATTFNASLPVIPFGVYRVSMASNGVPSLEQLVEAGPNAAPVLGDYPETTAVHGTTFSVTPSSAPNSEHRSVTYGASGSPEFLGTLSIDAATGVVTIMNARPIGIHTITVTASTPCAMATRNFTLTVTQITAPVITATPISSATVNVTWPAVPGAASYDILRSVANGPLTGVGNTADTSFMNGGLTINTTYVYAVQAIDNNLTAGPLSNLELATTTIFNDDPLIIGNTLIKAQHIAQARTAVNAVRAAAGLDPFVFTDAMLTTMKAIHIQELRSALNEARGLIGVPPAAFTHPATAGTIVRALDLTEIRNGVK